MNTNNVKRLEIISSLIPLRRDLFHLMQDESVMDHKIASADLERALNFLSGAISILNTANPCEE